LANGRVRPRRRFQNQGELFQRLRPLI
jgi:hypothetical protein